MGVDKLKAKCLVAAGRVPLWDLDEFASPAEGGSVTATPDRELYPDGTLVQVRVEPAPDHFFKKWKGDASGKDEVSLVLMDAHRKAKAKLKPLARVEVERQGAGEGRVTGLRIDCGDDCEDVYQPKFELKLRAFPAPGSTLAEWIGCDSIEPDGRCLVVAKGVRAVQAVFEPED